MFINKKIKKNIQKFFEKNTEFKGIKKNENCHPYK